MEQGAEGFRILGRDHLAALLLLAACGAAIVRIGKRGGPRSRAWTGRLLAGLLFGSAAANYARGVLAGGLSWEYSLPLELCHWVLAACLAALLLNDPLASEIAYFWGMGGTLQAVLTPDLPQGFPSWDFVLFYWAHGSILLAIAYLIAVRGFRPRPRSVVRMMIAANLYLVIVGSLDLAFGWNYGYLMHPPAQPSLLDWLGPWPWYLVSLEVVALAIFWILSLPWKVRRAEDAGA